MATLQVTAERLTVHAHPNADALELAQVGLYRAVVAKGQFRTGDWALYIPEGSLLPTELIAELGLTGRLAGPERSRVKAIRLRGELSQGIVCVPKRLAGVDLSTVDGHDFAAELGVTKWVPAVPVHMSGDMVAAPDLLPWIEIEDIKRYPRIFEPGEQVTATEKVHGTACLFTLIGGESFVSSKGFGAKRLGIAHNPHNLYWRAIEAYGVPAEATRIAEHFGADRVGIFGEVFGRRVQDLTYGADATAERPGYAIFDAAIEVGGTLRWLSSGELRDLVTLPTVPLLYEGPYDETALLELANGRETVSGKELHIREGLVVRPARERYSAVVGGRAIAKFVSGAYLTRKNGTEYE
ncbi:RNA ligase (ATP) [Actinoallomurus sp. CA-150999]|uniref:RNA ligase (ATP) n=1 Tax=Actinoallomurus sp. CA-150999 TaxID=3239887 RepID=UPI003D8A5C1F